MSTYVDSLMPCRPNGRWPWSQSCHLFADTLDELHDFATRLGLRRAWFQNHRRLPHYDLTSNKRRQAVKLGAVEATRKQVAIMFWGEDAAPLGLTADS